MIYKNVTRYITYTHSYNEVKMHSYKFTSRCRRSSCNVTYRYSASQC